MLLPWSKPTTIALGANGIAIKSDAESSKSLVKLDHCYQDVTELAESLSEVSAEVDATIVNFLISNHFARYLVLPWQEGIVSRQEWVALAEHAFRNSFGSVAEQWEVRVSLSGYGERVVACAIDQALIDSLQAIAVENKWQIAAIEPLLMTALHQISLEHENTWILFGEPERIVLAEYQQGQWRSFSMINPPHGMELAQSQQLLMRQLAQVGERPKQVLTCLSPQLAGDLRIEGIQVKTLRIGNVNKTSNCALWMASI